jgi:ATP-binding cassette subfamily B protein
MVLTDEGIVEQGTHNELLDKKGVYYRFNEMVNELA